MDAVAAALAGANFERLNASLARDSRGRWGARLDDVHLGSAFQPVYSLAHGRAVGHEALLRARDGAGRPVAARTALRGDGSFADMLRADRAARLIHALNFAEHAPSAHWLFLNIQPQVFVAIATLIQDGFQRRLLERSGLPGHQFVLEVVEDAVPEGADFDGGLRGARHDGCLIALDDFGAGHSNFDRVWRLKPEIVKLDRGLVRRAAIEPQAQRVVAQMVTLLHHCGALVLMEGVQTEAEAFVALDANADLVQGEWFGAPATDLAAPTETPQALRDLWGAYEDRRARRQQGYQQRIRPYVDAIAFASLRLVDGDLLADATRAFLRLPQAEVSYLIDRDGRQIGDNAWAEQRLAREPPSFAPMRETEGAQWGRRPYFRRAMESVGEVQVTRPYRTLHGAHLCVTVSVAFCAGPDELRVVCGDIGWEGSES